MKKVILENIYSGTTAECLTETTVYIKKDYLNKLSNKEQSQLIGEPSWKGQYYKILPKEIIKFDRSNNYDRSYFKLESGTEFLIECGKPLSFFEESKFKLKELKGNPYDTNYLEFVKQNPKFINQIK